MKLLGQLQEAKGDLPAAQKTYALLDDYPDIPKEVRQECELLLVRALVRTGKYADAERKLQALSKEVPPSDPEAVRLQVYEAECLAAKGNVPQAEAKLKAITAGDGDAAARQVQFLGLFFVERRHSDAQPSPRHFPLGDDLAVDVLAG